MLSPLLKSGIVASSKKRSPNNPWDLSYVNVWVDINRDADSYTYLGPQKVNQWSSTSNGDGTYSATLSNHNKPFIVRPLYPNIYENFIVRAENNSIVFDKIPSAVISPQSTTSWSVVFNNLDSEYTNQTGTIEFKYPKYLSGGVTLGGWSAALVGQANPLFRATIKPVDGVKTFDVSYSYSQFFRTVNYSNPDYKNGITGIHIAKKKSSFINNGYNNMIRGAGSTPISCDVQTHTATRLRTRGQVHPASSNITTSTIDIANGEWYIVQWGIERTSQTTFKRWIKVNGESIKKSVDISCQDWDTQSWTSGYMGNYSTPNTDNILIFIMLDGYRPDDETVLSYIKSLPYIQALNIPIP